jgi:hypothetical protein
MPSLGRPILPDAARAPDWPNTDLEGNLELWREWEADQSRRRPLNVQNANSIGGTRHPFQVPSRLEAMEREPEEEERSERLLVGARQRDAS